MILRKPADSSSENSDKQKELLRRVRRIQFQTAKLIRDILSGQYESTFKGRGMAFSEVREYIVGDDIRDIDWNVTARMNTPYIKKFVEERELTIMLAVDVSRSGLFGSGLKRKIDLAIEIAAIIAFSAIHNNDRVGLILFTDKVEMYVPPRKGTSHVLRLVRDLLFFEPMGTSTSVKAALDFLNRVQRRRSVVFLISDFSSPDNESSMPATAKRHDLIPVRITDPFEERWPSLGLIEFEDLETGKTLIFDSSSKQSNEALAAVFHKVETDLEHLFRSLNSDVITLRTDRSVVDPLRRFFKLRRRRK